MSESPLPQPLPGDAPPGPYGLPGDMFRRLWSIDDVCRFCDVERDKARQLLAADGAPPRLRMGSARCHRWNPVQVVAWLHGDAWEQPGDAARGVPARFPGTAWAPGGEP